MSSLALTYATPREPEKAVESGWTFGRLDKRRREILFWMLQTSFWGSVGIIGLLATLAFESAVPEANKVILMRVVSGFVGTIILRQIFRMDSFQQGGLAKWPVAFGCCVAMAVTELILLKAMVTAGISLPGAAETVGAKLIVVRLFTLTIWSSLYFAFHLLENVHAMELRITRAELAARENEIRHLQAQLNPHFLLNGLNTVIACKDDAESVTRVTQGLSEYLRFLLQETRPLEPLSREIEALEKYLTLHAPHFRDNLVCRIQCEKAARAVMVPPMIIQPLLEDAFHYRAASNDRPLQIWVTARVEKDFLRVSVSNTTYLSPEGSQPQGNGLRALHPRLELALGKNAKVDQEADNGWNRVTIHVPLAPAA